MYMLETSLYLFKPFAYITINMTSDIISLNNLIIQLYIQHMQTCIVVGESLVHLLNDM